MQWKRLVRSNINKNLPAVLNMPCHNDNTVVGNICCGEVGLEVVLISVVVYNHCGHWLVSILLRYTLIILFYMNAKLL